MSENSKLYYKTCRENAGLTQEEACYHLCISETTTLSKYENGHLKVDSDLVAQMALLYRNRLLPIWHLRYTNPALAEYIPDPKELFNDSEFVLQFEFASDQITKISNKAKKFMKNDGRLSGKEMMKLSKQLPKMRGAINDFTGFVNYIESQSAKMEKNESLHSREKGIKDDQG